MYSRRQGHS